MSFHPQMDYGRGHHRSARALPEEGPAFTYSAEDRARLEEICTHYPPERRKSAILYALFIAQGLLDTVVPAPLSFKLIADLRLAGVDATYMTYPTNHDGTMAASLPDSTPFVRQRL